jgi:endonuclease/exonuclease/phosphatase family metal-dependent hydrolase
VEFTAVSWNLFHGRDFPPDPALFSWRSRLLGTAEQNATHVQVNRDLEDEFAAILAGAEWDVALLQECPPRFADVLALACEAEQHRVLTSRNSLGGVRAFVARRNPDLIASGEGGSNLTLVRTGGALGKIVERRELTIHSGRPERRAMAFTQTANGVALSNLHATNDQPGLATEDIVRAAAAATEWAGKSPLLFGGDLNLRPGQNPEAFDQLRSRFGLASSTAPQAIDHLLVCGLDVVERPAPWPVEQRELPDRGRRLRLSDHTPIQARFKTGSP